MDAVMVAAATPERSLEQRMDALARANEIRINRAQRKRELKARRVHVTALLRETPPELVTMKVYDLLLATPKIGRVKAGKVLARHGIAFSKTVGGLSERQRRELLLVLALPSG